MPKLIATIAACVTLLWAGTVRAKITPPTAQERCDKARVIAWKTYVSCVDGNVAKNYYGSFFDGFAAHAKCRHAYFNKWQGFQSSLPGTTCFGSRFTDDGVTVTDHLSGLVWEKKTIDASEHDQGVVYTWSSGAPYAGDGTAYTSFLLLLNSLGFAGTNDWRLPTFAELQTLLLDFKCTRTVGPSCSCPSSPCVDPTVGATHAGFYWSATIYAPISSKAWTVDFDAGHVSLGALDAFTADSVRAVRGGL